MKNTRTARLVVVIALLTAAGVLLLWNSIGGVPAATVAEERANQERMHQDLPRPNESAPRKGADTPR